MEAATIAHAGHDDHEHHGPPEANQSSRMDAQTLGMLLFIISELMLFGAFFTAYFFIRIVNHDVWPPGAKLPVDVAAVNTGILLSSSLTMHWALVSAQRGNRWGMKAGMVSTILLGATFLITQINEYVHLGVAPQDNASASVFYSLTGLHGAHVLIGLIMLLTVCIRVFRGHFSPEKHHGMEVPGIYWHFVDGMWILVFTTLYIL